MVPYDIQSLRGDQEFDVKADEFQLEEHSNSINNKLGDLKEVDFFFHGIGAIDEISISNPPNKVLVYDKFNEF